MSDHERHDEFLRRFETLRRKMRLVRGGTVLATAMLALAALVALLAAVDFRSELGWSIRAVALGLGVAVIALTTLVALTRIALRWSRPTTAAALERQFPQLGQRVRTTVQYSDESDDEIRQDGVAPTLVEALAEETSAQTRPLGIGVVVPTRRMLAAAALATAAVAALFAVASLDWEWRTALRRTLLADVPYTRLNVDPGHVLVDEGKSVHLAVTLRGRTDREVVLLSRPSKRAGADWTETLLDPAAAKDAGTRTIEYTAKLPKITEPTEYRILAGPERSGVYDIAVRYPLAIESVRTEIVPPEYTGLPAKTHEDGNVTALRGSRATFTVTLDRVPSKAEAVLRRTGALAPGEQRERTVPLTIDGRRLSMELDLTEDLKWSVVAESGDRTPLPENAFRIRVREDQPPQVSFESPDDFLEVHTLAEVLMRIRTGDDYGLKKSGIVFQINNNEEHTLLEEDFAAVADAAAEADATGTLSPRTRASLDRVLPLEHFALTQKDCVIYYAFAEDNFPEGPHRAETDLRFIDIRPFKQVFRIREPGEPGMPGDGFTSLEELIRRQRYTLNRTIGLSRRPETGGDQMLNSVDRLIEMQTEIADLTRELAENLIQRGADDVDALFQAEASMLGAVDSLSVTRYDDATLQEKDAQQYLVEARNRLEILLMQAQNNSALRQALALLDRRLAQKLRRQNEEDAETPERIVERLRRLANEEQQIAGMLTAMAQGLQGNGQGGMMDETNEEPMEDPSSDGSAPENPSEDAENPEAPAAETDDPAEETEGGEMPAEETINPRELENRQYDALVEAQDIQRVLAGLEGVTELAQERMTEAVANTDAASGSLARGETDEAAKQTADAAGQFRELARHVAALTAEETSERIAMSRDTAAEIADRQRSLADDLDDREPVGRDAEPAERSAPEAEAERLAARAETLEDVLTAIARNPRPEDGDAADRVADIAAEQEVPETVERVADLPERINDEETPPAVVAEVRDTADRMEVTARELDRLYRSIVMPRIEQLRDLEEQAAALEEQMQRIESSSGVGEWYRDAEELLDDLEQAGGGGQARDELDETLSGLDGVAATAWVRGGGGYFAAPSRVRVNVRLLVENLQRQIQELVLADILADRDEPTPPQYQHLVERYLKVLSSGEAKEE